MAGLAAEGLKYDKVIGQSADLFTLQRFINRSKPQLSKDQQQNLTRWADLAVVVLLILIPLISPNSSKGGIGFQAIAEALGLAAVKAAVAITAIIAGGRLLLRPIYRQIVENQNAEIFSANTLLVILGTSLLTARWAVKTRKVYTQDELDEVHIEVADYLQTLL